MTKTSSVPDRLRRQVQERAQGISSSGRATVALLHLNDVERVAYRLGLIDIGHYPDR
jgi:hypothetical protein